MARENSALSQPKFSAMGIWKTPKLVRTENPVNRIRHPEMSTGVKNLVDLSFKVFRGSGLIQNSRFASFQVSLVRALDHPRDWAVPSETRSASRRANTPPTIIRAAARSISQCMGPRKRGARTRLRKECSGRPEAQFFPPGRHEKRG